jgi:hypothetical protein
LIFLDRSNPSGQKRDAGLEPGVIILGTNRFKVLASLGCAVMMSIFASPTSGQTVTTNADRAQLLQQQTQPPFGTVAPEGFVDGHAVETPNDADIGQQDLVTGAAQYQPFSASLTTPIFYTSNVGLTPNHEFGAAVFAPAAAVSYNPRITSTLYGHFGVREQVFYYDNHRPFDFGSLDCEAGLNYSLPEFHNLLLRAWYDFNRLTLDHRIADEFFSNHQILLNAEVPIRIGNAQQISIGADTLLSVGADHQSPRRNDYEQYVGYSVSVTSALSLQAVGRFVVREYYQNSRHDISEIVSAVATYRITNWCAVSAISSFAHNESNQDAFDYDVGNAGGALELSLKF